MTDKRRHKSRLAGLSVAFAGSVLLNAVVVLPLFRALLRTSDKIQPDVTEVEITWQEPKKRRKKQRRVRPKRISPIRNGKRVELDTPASKTPPKISRYLSDKNRVVKKQTRAKNVALLKLLQEPQRKTRPKNISPAPRRSNIARSVSRSLSRLALTHADYDRIFDQHASVERRRARRAEDVVDSAPQRRGTVAQKWARVRAALNNFIPEVTEGRQTTLNTRADPFAVYIARMHRRIHAAWGFGFLADLDRRSSNHVYRDPTLLTKIEIVINKDGTVHKTTIVRPSGILPFDTAALHAVFSSAPFTAPPTAIHSANGKTYLHWRFHRDARQCGVYGVDPFILSR